MAERLYSSADVPEYGSYPESPRAVTGGMNSEASPKDASRVADKVADLKERGSEMLDAATDRAKQLRQQAVDAGSQYTAAAQERAREMARRGRELSQTAVRDYPVHLIVAAGVIGLLFGLGLRAWRENRV